ncbi:eotaxin-like [Astyanax mexicanus]|uniref:Eotaxin-like n=1 Tax=Astyanax mexicanus TaxID=7994 RepID=A0A8T2MIZ5_ASTMX|nr:eotaxin-like [Astyanax mexicanus]
MRTVLLCLTTALLLTATQRQAANGPVGKCKCMRTSNTVLQIQRIKSYYVQKSGLCHVDAVEFTTVRGITVCSDSKKPWVKKAMTVLDARTRTSSTPSLPTKTTDFRPNDTDSGPVSSVFTCKCSQISNTSEDYGFSEQNNNCCNITTLGTVTPEPMRISSVPLKALTDILSVEATVWNSSTAALLLNTTQPTKNVTGQDFMEDSLQTLETTTGLMRNLPSETFCMQITED